MIGQHLLHYRILALLGRGGMGEVYLAHDEKLDREVAIKILPASEGGEGRRLRREARALAALSHPNIVTIHAVEEVDGRPFLVMERLEGSSLKEFIRPGGLPLEEFFALALPLTAAVAAAHERGILHRDLKPGNILISPDGHLKVLDFGLARRNAELAEPDRNESQAETVVGTLPYLAPEVIENQPIDTRADVFSLGILLHEMATGWRPFHGETHAGQMIAIVCNRRIPARFEKSLPQELPAILDRCLANKKAQRFANAGQLNAELRRLHGPGFPAARKRGWPGWQNAGVALVAVLLLVVLGFIAADRFGAADRSHLEAEAPPPTTNLEALNAYERGREFSWLITDLELATKAQAYLERAVELDPDFVLAWCELATTHAQVVHFGIDPSPYRVESALRALDKASRLAPDAAEVHRARGFVYYWAQRHYDDALVELGKAIEMNPRDARAREGRAFIYRRRGNMQAAIEEIRRVVELSPQDGRAWRELGVTATYLRRYDEALHAFDQAIQLSPDPMIAYLSQTRVHWMRGDFTAARHKLDSRPPIEQELPHFHAFWQSVYEDRLTAALAELDQVASPVFSWSTIYTPVASLRAQVYGWQGKEAEARDQFRLSLEQIDRLLSHQREDPRLHALRSQALIGLGEKEAARRELEKALELAENADFIAASEVHFEATISQVQLGDFEAALRSLERILAEPSNLLSPPLLARDPRFRPLHADPRFASLIAGSDLAHQGG